MKFEDYNRAFTTIAPYYDKLMSFINYEGWVAYIEKIIALSNIKEKLILDLACGTGVCLELWLKKHYRVIGLDMSLSMLQICRDKLSRFYLADGYDSFLINGDMRNFALSQKIPITTCLYDSLNYLLDEESLLFCFKEVKEILTEDGVFVFDMNTIQSLRNEWGNKIYHRQDGNIHSVWENTFDPITNISLLKLTLNIQADGRKITMKELHQERAYPLSVIKNLLSEAGLKSNLYRHLTFHDARESDLRIMGVARQ